MKRQRNPRAPGSEPWFKVWLEIEEITGDSGSEIYADVFESVNLRIFKDASEAVEFVKGCAAMAADNVAQLKKDRLFPFHDHEAVETKVWERRQAIQEKFLQEPAPVPAAAVPVDVIELRRRLAIATQVAMSPVSVPDKDMAEFKDHSSEWLNGRKV